MALTQLLRFSLTKSRIAAFTALRNNLSSTALVKSQHFGFILPNEGFPAQKSDHEMCWIIRITLVYAD
jgi:hypothetical protein